MERNINVREKHQLVASYAPLLDQTEPTTQARALTRNRTRDLSFCRMRPKQLSHTGQGSSPDF